MDTAKNNLHKKLRNEAISLERESDALAANGDTAGAMEKIQRSLEISKELLGIVGQDDPVVLRDISLSLLRIGDMHVATGNTSGAKVEFE